MILFCNSDDWHGLEVRASQPPPPKVWAHYSTLLGPAWTSGDCYCLPDEVFHHVLAGVAKMEQKLGPIQGLAQKILSYNC